MKIALSNNAKKTLLNMEKQLASRIAVSINKIPLGDIKKLKNSSSDYRLRVGDYRILFNKIDNDNILICEVLPRGNAYKNKR